LIRLIIVNSNNWSIKSKASLNVFQRFSHGNSF